MATILICDRANDAHLLAVQWGLQTLGHDVLTWDTSRFPARDSLSVWFDGGAERRIAAGALDLDRADTIWSRRLGRPTLSADTDPEDVEFATTQSVLHLDSMLATMGRRAFWANPAAATRHDLHKPLQLRLARDAGLAVPATLISNDPEAIRAFCEARPQVVYKPYAGGVWSSKDNPKAAKVNFTTLIHPGDLDSDVALSICPGIFQERVVGAYEVRITVMGRTHFAVRIETGSGPDGGLDWRQAARRVQVSPLTLPPEVAGKIDAVMTAGGLVFACFDFIVSPDGTYHFLEFNQAGQFLWLEERLPQLPLLDAMSKFLASGDTEFRYADAAPDVRLADAPAPVTAR